MTRRHASLITLLILALSAPLGGCDATAKLTEQEHIQRAKDFEDKGNLRGSIIELKNAILKNPDSPQARLLLGQIYLKVGMGADAEKELKRSVELGVNIESVKPELGEALLYMGEYQRVLDEIVPSERSSSANLARILQLRADALLRLGKLQEACNLFQQSLDTDKNNAPTYWGLSLCAVAQHDMTKAREWLDAALEIKAAQPKTWVYIGNWEHLSKNTEAALAAYTRALELDPAHLEALQNRATLNTILGRFDPAKKDIDHYQKLAPKSLLANYLQAFLLFNQQKYPEARDVLQEVFKVSDNHIPSILLAASTAYALETYQQAETLLQRFLSRFPNHVYARKLMAATQIKLGRADRALENLAPLLSEGTNDVQTLTLASDAYRANNEPLKAATLLQRAAAIDPKNASIKTQLGIAHLSAGETSLAITELEAAAAQGGSQTVATELLAQTYLARKQYDKALAVIGTLEKRSPKSPVPHILRANVLLGKKDVANARRSFEKALALEPANFTAASSLAQLDLLDRKPESARKRFERILESDKNNLQAMMALAKLAYGQQQQAQAIAWLEKAAKLHPQAISPHTALVSHHLSRRDYQKALTIANATVNKNPESLEALTLLGKTQLAAGDVPAAIAAFNKLVQRTGQSADAHVQLALAQIAGKKLKDARSSLEKALQIKPGDIPSQEILIRLDMTENKPAAALEIARRMQAQQPALPTGYDREGDLQLAQNRIAEAAQAYQRALDKGAGSAGMIKWFRAQVLLDPAVAEQRLASWLKQNPADSVVRGYAAEYAMRKGRNKEAIAHYEAINRIAPNKVLVLNNLAYLYLLEKDPRALQTAQQALDLAPNDPSVQDTLGWILVQQGQAQRGLEWLRKAKAQAPRQSSIRYHLAVALAETGNRSEARKELESLLADAPQFADAERARALLKRL